MHHTCNKKFDVGSTEVNNIYQKKKKFPFLWILHRMFSMGFKDFGVPLITLSLFAMYTHFKI